ncbi:SMI1/KNR4 family protein [Parageobacillus thermoglucosidasius]|uniref:SMI1/KNR4 family protein n=1 Tax=Parageobacillus thermoglucosidasius TaxID=1426 RepID=UPI001FCC8C91|nr:SMI1/KNR4 family protein [Parageobacillus thermoglucosidasius]
MVKNIWREGYDNYKLDTLTDEAVEKAEEILKVKLPKSYINILKVQNGGYIKFNSYPCNVPTSWANNHINVEHIWGIDEVNGILESENLIKEWGLPNNIVLISGDGHSWIALDYRKMKENPPVIYIDIELNQIVEIANSFDEFLDGLYIEEFEDDSTTWIEKEWTLEEINTALSSNDEQIIIRTLNYLLIKPNEHVDIIEQKLMALLQNSNPQIKELAVIYAYHFNQKGVLSAEYIDQIISILRIDKEVKDYLDMFNAEKYPEQEQ